MDCWQFLLCPRARRWILPRSCLFDRSHSHTTTLKPAWVIGRETAESRNSNSNLCSFRLGLVLYQPRTTLPFSTHCTDTAQDIQRQLVDSHRRNSWELLEPSTQLPGPDFLNILWIHQTLCLKSPEATLLLQKPSGLNARGLTKWIRESQCECGLLSTVCMHEPKMPSLSRISHLNIERMEESDSPA